MLALVEGPAAGSGGRPGLLYLQPHLGEALRAAVDESGRTVREVAARAGVSAGAAYGIIAGNRGGSRQMLLALLAACECPEAVFVDALNAHEGGA